MTGGVRSALLSNRTLHLILLPTEGCNFRCTYCYEDFKIGRMRPEVVQGLKRFLDRRLPELDHLQVSWFGGEPLLAVDVVRNVLGHIARLRSRREVTFTSDMTTNAHRLTPDLFRELLGLGNTAFQITLDGTGPEHDRKRKLARGGGSFAVIWENLSRLREVDGDFRVMVRIHVDRGNQEDLSTLLAQCGETFAGDARFEFMIRPLARLGGPNDAALDVLGEGERDGPVARLAALARELGLRPWSPAAGEDLCYAARPNSLVIRADGRIGKCTVALRDPANDVGRLREDGTLTLDREAMLPWMRGLWSGAESELACPYRGLKKTA